MPNRDVAPVGAPCWVELGTTDAEVGRAFYTELFGWTLVDPGPEYGGYVNFAKDGVLVAGSMQIEGASGWTVYLASPDAETTAAAASANGGAVVMPPMEVMALGTMAVLSDPAGHAIGVWQPGEHKGFGVFGEADTPGWFELHTNAYDASIDFYKKVFSFDAQVASDEPTFRYTTYGAGENQLAGIMDFGVFGSAGEPAGWSVYFKVDDTDKTIARATDLGAKVVSPAEDTPYGRLAQLTDPTGASFKLMS